MTLLPWLLASVAALSPLSSSSLVAGAGCDGRSDKKELQAAAPCSAPTYQQHLKLQMSTAFELVLNGVTRSNWVVIQVMDVLGPDPTIVVMLYSGPGT